MKYKFNYYVDKKSNKKSVTIESENLNLSKWLFLQELEYHGYTFDIATVYRFINKPDYNVYGEITLSAYTGNDTNHFLAVEYIEEI